MAESVKRNAPFKTQSAVKSPSQKDMNVPNLTKPCNLAIQRFYRIMFTDSNWHKMKFPPLFVKLFGKDIDSATTATLVVTSGQTWTASISHEDESVYLKRGWMEFLRDNLVRKYEVLTFAYLGNMRFLVRVFDISGLERMNVIIPEKKKPNHIIERKCDSGEGKQNLESVKKEQKKIAKTEMEDILILPSPTTKKPNLVVNKNCDSGKCIRNSDCGKKEQKKIAKEKETDDIIMLPAPTPYFTINIETYHISKEGYAIVPDSFAKKYLTGTNVKGRLVVGGWTDLVQFRNENDQWLIGHGWNEFASGNKLRLMDTCVFELVDPEKLKFKVSFRRRNVQESNWGWSVAVQ